MKLDTTREVARRAMAPFFFVHSILRKFILILSPPIALFSEKQRPAWGPSHLGSVTHWGRTRYYSNDADSLGSSTVRWQIPHRSPCSGPSSHSSSPEAKDSGAF